MEASQMSPRPNDAFDTPDYAVAQFLPVLRIKPKTILEPAAGTGVIVGQLWKRWPGARVDAFDVEPRDNGAYGIIQRGFFFDDEPGGYDLVIGNPPFSLIYEFVLHALTKLNPGGVLAFLSPAAFFESKARREFNRTRPPHHTYILPERVSFTEDGKTDQRMLAWLVWRENGGRKYAPRIGVL